MFAGEPVSDPGDLGDGLVDPSAVSHAAEHLQRTGVACPGCHSRQLSERHPDLCGAGET
jgi:hypothetical protein